MNYRTHISSHTGYRTHAAIIAADTGRAYTSCGRIMTNWYDDKDFLVVDCKHCIRKDGHNGSL